MTITKRRIILAVFLAPLAAPVSMVLIFCTDSDINQSNVHELWVILLLGVPCAYVVMFFLGLPFLYLVNRINKISFVTVTAGSVMLTLVPWLFLNRPWTIERTLNSQDIFEIGRAFFLAGVCGFLVGCAFWVISGIGSQRLHNQTMQSDSSPTTRRG